MASALLSRLQALQDVLDFRYARGAAFRPPNGPGCHGVAGLSVGALLGFSAALLLLGLPAGLPSGVINFFAYTFLLAVFHAGEWYCTAAHRPKELEYKSWIINHSVAYTAVQLASVLEFWLEYLLFPSLKGHWSFMALAFLLCLGAIGVRILGMAHCGENFDHIVMQERKEGHQLVTSGIYQYLRHPAYFGFYYWSVFAQLLLANPLLFVACAVVSRKFFCDRIPPEEEVLVNIYGKQYIAYAERTPIAIPFVSGFVAYTGKASEKK
eukprot:TRINITY_DN19876_c0_g1_i1.p1 TRINITY_DN19876_c0_g1~~TRINITY_DN19876_c0_g1_i1.p1  ORF type:complete len:267 (-),score=34.95 TRINITY_DN19876_c0_g1_i1:70-870(-)